MTQHSTIITCYSIHRWMGQWSVGWLVGV